MPALGGAIRRRREARGWTVYRLAQKVGMSDPYLATIENGKSKRMGIAIVARIARALGITTDELLADAGMPVEPSASDGADLQAIYRDLSAPARRIALEHVRLVKEMQEHYGLVSRDGEDESADVEREGEDARPWAAYDKQLPPLEEWPPREEP